MKFIITVIDNGEAFYMGDQITDEEIAKLERQIVDNGIEE